MLALSTTWVQGTNCQPLGLAAATLTVQAILLAQSSFEESTPQTHQVTVAGTVSVLPFY